MIMVVQATMFYAPSVFWNTMNDRGGVDSDNIIAAARSFSKAYRDEHRESTLRILRNQIHR